MTKLQTDIIAVSVYPDRARVVRGGTVTLEPGKHKLEVSELPLKLDVASVRASARGTARARLFGVDARRDFYVETPAERVRELEKRIESLEDERRSLDAQTEMFKQEHATLGDLSSQTKIYARGLAYGKIDIEAQMSLLDGLRARTEGLNAVLLDLAIRRRDLERRLKKLQNELGQLRGTRGRERYTAIVEVEVTQAGDLDVELTYVVSGTGWRPLYDIRLTKATDQPAKIEIGYLAQVTQRTGEDWSDVALGLSTARPALAETLPELGPWYIRPVVPPQPKRARRKEKMSSGAVAPAPATEIDAFASLSIGDAMIADEEAQVVMATVETTGTAVTYQVPGTVTVPADGAPHKVTVTCFELAPELDYVTAPKLIEATYRRARVANESAYTFLPGSANLFDGDEFIGTTKLELVAPGGELEIYLGTDDRVRVKRKLERREVDKKLLGDRRRLRYGYEIMLENLLPNEIQVALQDQIPVPRHEDIKVKLEFVEPKPAEQTELNLLEWTLALEPDSKRVARFDFTVEHPREMRLVGLPE